jgi:hypothetical protein
MSFIKTFVKLIFLSFLIFITNNYVGNAAVSLTTKKSEILAVEDLEINEQEDNNHNIEQNISTVKVEDVQEGEFINKAALRGLNKITAKTFLLTAQINETVTFERLIIKPLKCWKAPATERPENKVLLKIYEKKLDGTKVLIFFGWMFSSSPGLSGLEHPTYDVTLKECVVEGEN